MVFRLPTAGYQTVIYDYNDVHDIYMDVFN